MATLPVHRNEQTGNAVLDRLQTSVRRILAYLAEVKADTRLEALEAANTNSPVWSAATAGASLAVTASAGNFTTGVQFNVGRPSMCTGIRFWGVATTQKTVRCKLYDNAGNLIASASTIITRPGSYSVTWKAVALTPFALYRVCTYQTDGLNYYAFVNTAANAPVRPFYAGGAVVIYNWGLFLAGDTAPTSTAAAEAYPVEPVLS